MIPQGIFIWVICIGFFTSILTVSPNNTKNDEFTLKILHTNDMHSKFDQISATTGRCGSKAAKAGKCYGGFARIATLVRQARNSSIPTIFLNAGDNYQGSLICSIYKERVVGKILSLVNPNVMSLGTHEFDNGPEGLSQFLTVTNFSIVAANLDFSKEPALAASRIKKSVVLDVAGHKIGVIGYLTNKTQAIVIPGKVKFLDEVQAIKDEVKKLQAQGVKILIALGHSGYEVDKKVAAEVDGLDLVVGGRTNTFLYNGKQPDLETPEGPYPTVIIQKNGRKVYVVQTYGYTKYLGNLNINFNAVGEIKSIQGNPILVNSSIEEDKDVLTELVPWRIAYDITSVTAGRSKVLLDGEMEHCRTGECNLGNLITDAMIDYNVEERYDTKKSTDPVIAIYNSGVIKKSINKTPNDTITLGDILESLPYYSKMVKLIQTGKQINEMLEHNVYDLNLNDTSDLNGDFLQFSGLKVVYDLSQPGGSRVVPGSVMVRCPACTVSTFSKLDNNKTYTVLTTDRLCRSRSYYKIMQVSECIAPATSNNVISDIVKNYIRKNSPIEPRIEGRITFLTPTTKTSINVSISTPKPTKIDYTINASTSITRSTDKITRNNPTNITTTTAKSTHQSMINASTLVPELTKSHPSTTTSMPGPIQNNTINTGKSRSGFLYSICRTTILLSITIVLLVQ